MPKKTLNKKEYETLSHFRYQLRRFMRFSEQITHDHGITHLQYLLLLHIKGFKGRDWATIGELAERLQSHHHGVVSLVTRCEKLGLVFRQKSAVDGRIIEVRLTPEGEKIVEKLARMHRDELLSSQGIFQVPGTMELQGDESEAEVPVKRVAKAKN